MYRCAVRDICSILHNSVIANCHIASDEDALTDLRISTHNRICVNQIILPIPTPGLSSTPLPTIDPFCTTALFKRTPPQPIFAYGLIYVNNLPGRIRKMIADALFYMVDSFTHGIITNGDSEILILCKKLLQIWCVSNHRNNTDDSANINTIIYKSTVIILPSSSDTTRP